MTCAGMSCTSPIKPLCCAASQNGSKSPAPRWQNARSTLRARHPQEDAMSMLSSEELDRLSSAESLFASPIPVQSVSSDEFMPGAQTPKQREFEARVRDIGTQMAKRLGTSRRGAGRTNLAYGYALKSA